MPDKHLDEIETKKNKRYCHLDEIGTKRSKKRSCHHMIKIRGDIVTLWNSSMKVSSWTELR